MPLGSSGLTVPQSSEPILMASDSQVLGHVFQFHHNCLRENLVQERGRLGAGAGAGKGGTAKEQPSEF